MKKLLIALAASASVLAGVSVAQAGDTSDTSTGQLTVKAYLKSGCTINFNGKGQQTEINFGNVSSLDNPITQQGQFYIQCSNTKDDANNTYIAGFVSLNSGNVALPNGTTFDKYRLLANGQDTIQFQVYQDSGLSVVWGDGSTGNSKVYPTPVANGKAAPYDYWVSLLGGQDISQKNSGLYQNTLIATVNYANTPPWIVIPPVNGRGG